MPELPSIQEFLEIAPIASMVLLIVGLGFYIGWRSRGETISTLREWLDSIRKK